MRTTPRGFPGILCSLAVIHLTHTAHAEGHATAEIYSDARDLTVDLIQSEAAKSGASLLVCRAPEFILYYFPSTLQTMRRPPLNVDALGKSARVDAAELAGDWVRKSVEAGHVFRLVELQTKAKASLSSLTGLDQFSVSCKNMTDEASSNDPVDGLLTDRQAQVANPLNDCAGPYTTGGAFDSGKAQACELGLAVRSAVMGDAKATQSYLVGALMVPATTRASGTYEDWSKMKDDALSVLNASEDKYRDPLSTAFENVKGGEPIRDELRALAAHIRTTIQASGSPGGLQQLLISALSSSRIFLTAVEAGKVDKAITVIQSRQFLELLEAVKSGDGHRVIIEAIDTGSLAIAPDASGDSPDKRQAAIRVALSVLRYATEIHANQTAAESTREAAKAALFTYLSESGNAGFLSGKSRIGGEWLTASFGASFSTGYVNSDVQGLRAAASVEAFTFKVRLSQKQWSYAGVHISALNLLGSVGEVALRDPSKSYGNEDAGRMLALMAHPRVDFLYGVPAFSRKLALFAGFGVTTVAPVKRSDGSYTYEWILDRPKDSGGEFYPRFFDASIGIRLYPL